MTLPPPPGFATWLDWALANVDTRDLWRDALSCPEAYGWPAGTQRTDIWLAVRDELAELRERANRLTALKVKVSR